MKTLSSIEDYLEVISGKREPANLKPNNTWFGLSSKPILSLARYDVGFIDSVTDTTMTGGALTDRQAELAIKIVLKYRKQLHSHGIDIDPASVPPFRKALRIVDRTQSVDLIDDKIHVRFPYNQTWISTIRDMLKESQGGAKFNKEAKTWTFDLTEYNVNWIVTFAQANQFHISDELNALQNEIIRIGSQPWGIYLTRDSAGQIVLVNAEQSMLDYIHEQGLELHDDFLLKLADLSSVLGYKVDDSLWQEVDAIAGSDISVFMRDRTYELHGNFGQIDRVIRYAQLVNRLPVVIYDPSPTASIDKYRELLGDDNIYRIGNQRHIDDEQSRPVMWSHRVVRELNNIPLLMSHVGLIAGAEKQIMIQNSQKIIYFNQRLTG